jgi:hypothetical protein
VLFAPATWAQTTGTTNVRLDAIDLTKAPEGEFVFFASFLDKYRKPIRASEAGQWTISIDGVKKEGVPSIEMLGDSQTHGISVVFVVARYAVFELDELYGPSKRGVSNAINKLNSGTDRAAVVTYANTVDSSGTSLTSALNEAVQYLEEAKPKLNERTPLLLEAVEKAVEMFPTGFAKVGPNRAVVIITDGFDKYQDNPARLKDLIKAIDDKAKKRNVRLNAIGVALETDDLLPNVKKLTELTNGTYREAKTPDDIELYLAHVSGEFSGQHVITFKTRDFEDQKKATFVLEVDNNGQQHASNKVIRRVPKKESHLGFYAMVGGAVLVGLLLLWLLIKLIVGLTRNRGDDEPVETGPDLSQCQQCTNMISPEWLVCKYCEALPHYGRLTVSSSGDLNGHAFFIKESQVTVGKDPANHIVLEDASVSKRHAGIAVKDNKFELSDFASTNKTWVNGQEIHKQFLKDGDEVGFGAVKMRFKLKR